MKTTVNIPDELLIAAKKQAAESGLTLRELFESGLRRELETRPLAQPRRPTGKPIRWPTTKGGLPPGLDISSREKMYQWIFSPSPNRPKRGAK